MVDNIRLSQLLKIKLGSIPDFSTAEGKLSLLRAMRSREDDWKEFCEEIGIFDEQGLSAIYLKNILDPNALSEIALAFLEKKQPPEPVEGFVIEKGIPRPKRNLREGLKRLSKNKSKYPLDKMSVGDSFFVKCEEADRRKIMNRILISSIDHYGKGRTSARIEKDGVRFWRIK